MYKYIHFHKNTIIFSISFHEGERVLKKTVCSPKEANRSPQTDGAATETAPADSAQ